jgi:hypothetical protein
LLHLHSSVCVRNTCKSQHTLCEGVGVACSPASAAHDGLTIQHAQLACQEQSYMENKRFQVVSAARGSAISSQASQHTTASGVVAVPVQTEVPEETSINTAQQGRIGCRNGGTAPFTAQHHRYRSRPHTQAFSQHVGSSSSAHQALPQNSPHPAQTTTAGMCSIAAPLGPGPGTSHSHTPTGRHTDHTLSRSLAL